MTNFDSAEDILFRKIMRATVSASCSEVGFADAEESAIETLTEILQSFIRELSRSSKAYSELSNRTDPLVADIIMSLVDMGQKINELPFYARRAGRITIANPLTATVVAEPKRLQVGVKRSHSSYIPDYYPLFPDPHTYIKSSTQKAPCNEYRVVREKASEQKRNVETALTKFMAKTGDTENLFSDDPYAFPLIANRQRALPYIDALLPREEGPSEDIVEDPARLVETGNRVKGEKDECGGVPKQANLSQALEAEDPDGLIDNPYLRPIKMPKLKTVGRRL